jgi:nucleotide-binding universal stress UspA family protein
MPNVILAVVELPDVAGNVLAAAGRLAELTAAVRINVLAIRIPPIETVMRTEEILSAKTELRIRTEERERTDQLKSVFDAWAVTMPPLAVVTAWADVEGRTDAVVAEWGRRADFIVLKRPWRQQPETERQAIHAALFDTGRPVLMVPPESPSRPFGKRVAIAWRQDSRTMKAVLAALRCLQRADHIDVLAGVRDGAPPPVMPDILEEHGVSADLHLLPVTGDRVFGEVLLAKAHALAADLLVVGAFARHPMRSLFLGGVTRHMLACADLPVLMRH